jgi:hypothetical protein
MRRGGEVASWRRQKSATFEDLPKRLQPREGESRERVIRRAWWLERHGLSVVDYLGWLHAKLGPHPPARRRSLSRKQQAELDKEREGWRW